MRTLLLTALVTLSALLGACQAMGPGLSPSQLSQRYSTGDYVASDYHSMTPETP